MCVFGVSGPPGFTAPDESARECPASFPKGSRTPIIGL